MPLDPYHQLGVERSASAADIDSAWKRKRRATHPDVNPDNPHAETQFKLAKEAYEILTDPERRARYDRGESVDHVTPEERGMGLIAGTLVQIIKQADEQAALADPRFSVIEALNETLENMKNGARTRKRSTEGVIEALVAQLKRVKFKGGGQNLIADVLASQIDRARAKLITHERDLADCTAAIELMKQYEGLPAEDLFTAMNEAKARYLTGAVLGGTKRRGGAWAGWENVT